MELIFTFENASQAIHAEQALLAAGVGVRVMPLPPQISAGCGLCVRVAPGERAATVRTLEEHAVPIACLYQKLAVGGATRYRPDCPQGGEPHE